MEKRCKDLYWYLHTSINSVSAYVAGGCLCVYVYMEDKVYIVCVCVSTMEKA